MPTLVRRPSTMLNSLLSAKRPVLCGSTAALAWVGLLAVLVVALAPMLSGCAELRGIIGAHGPRGLSQEAPVLCPAAASFPVAPEPLPPAGIDQDQLYGAIL